MAEHTRSSTKSEKLEKVNVNPNALTLEPQTIPLNLVNELLNMQESTMNVCCCDDGLSKHEN